jgi:predicted nuclease of predicted toxin-antitoxin system
MKLLIDMNLSPKWSEALVIAGFEAVHWSIIGRGDADDAEIMAYAAAQDAIVLTNDLDFGAILAVTGGEKPSVIQIRAETLDPDTIGPRVIAAVRQMAAELRRGALLSIDTSRTRIRVLPLGRA